MKNGDKSAFARPYSRDGLSKFSHDHYSQEGLTKREYFAAMAMQGLLANSFSDGSQKHLSHASFEEISKMAVHQADTILTELEKAN